MAGDEMVRYHTNSMDMNLSKLGGSEGQGSLACYSLWGCRVRHNLVIEQLCAHTQGHFVWSCCACGDPTT